MTEEYKGRLVAGFIVYETGNTASYSCQHFMRIDNPIKVKAENHADSKIYIEKQMAKNNQTILNKNNKVWTQDIASICHFDYNQAVIEEGTYRSNGEFTNGCMVI